MKTFSHRKSAEEVKIFAFKSRCDRFFFVSFRSIVFIYGCSAVEYLAQKIDTNRVIRTTRYSK